MGCSDDNHVDSSAACESGHRIWNTCSFTRFLASGEASVCLADRQGWKTKAGLSVLGRGEGRMLWIIVESAHLREYQINGWPKENRTGEDPG